MPYQVTLFTVMILRQPPCVMAYLSVLVAAGACATRPPGPSADPPGGGPLPAGVAVSAHETAYDIAGSSAAELRDAMLRAGPRRGGLPYYGYHAWDVRWRFRWVPDRGGCAVRRPVVTLTTQITLPRWRPPADAAPALVDQWDAFLAALRTHELGHRTQARRAAGDVARALEAMRTQGCMGIEADANAAARRALERGRAADRRYDAETRHGWAQGVAWPPS